MTSCPHCDSTDLILILEDDPKYDLYECIQCFTRILTGKGGNIPEDLMEKITGSNVQ